MIRGKQLNAIPLPSASDMIEHEKNGKTKLTNGNLGLSELGFTEILEKFPNIKEVYEKIKEVTGRENLPAMERGLNQIKFLYGIQNGSLRLHSTYLEIDRSTGRIIKKIEECLGEIASTVIDQEKKDGAQLHINA